MMTASPGSADGLQFRGNEMKSLNQVYLIFEVNCFTNRIKLNGLKNNCDEKLRKSQVF